jgi:hypothetical protein
MNTVSLPSNVNLATPEGAISQKSLISGFSDQLRANDSLFPSPAIRLNADGWRLKAEGSPTIP